MKRIYLDYAASTPVDKRVLVAMQPYFTEQFYNPSSLYVPARQVRQAYESARQSVAKLLGARSGEVIFTAGATESINLAIAGVRKQFPKARVLISALEHAAVVEAASSSALVAPVQASGLIDLAKLKKLLTDSVILISIQQANNEIGTIQPLAKIAKAVATVRADRARRGVRLPLYLHTDASQAANYLELKVQRLGVDLLSLNGGKMYGPKQSGVLYVRSGTQLAPLMRGGGQERGLRSGTENVAAAIGLAKALELAQTQKQKQTKRQASLRDYLLQELLKIKGVSLNGPSKHRLPNNINVSISGVDGETLVHYLDHAGVLAATGAACSANKDQTSPSLLAIGLGSSAANSSLRLSLGRATTKAEVVTAARIIKTAITKLQQLG